MDKAAQIFVDELNNVFGDECPFCDLERRFGIACGLPYSVGDEIYRLAATTFGIVEETQHGADWVIVRECKKCPECGRKLDKFRLRPWLFQLTKLV